MDAIMQNRFEGSIFFVYDRHFLQKEEDRLEDAIIYFYPHSMPVDNQCRLCGQLMGVVQFSDTIFNASPVLFRFGSEKIAVKHVGKYSFALAGSSVEPDSALLDTVDRLYFLFSFYHGSIHQVELECDNDKEKFLPEIRVIWEQYLAFIRNYGDNLPSVFNPIPYLPLKNDPNLYFLKASHILESCQRRPQIIAGSILYNRHILCSQLTDSISRCLLLLKPNQHNHPAVPIETDYQLPFGVRLFNVYLNRSELKEILENNDNSPYQSHSETISSLHCCCTGHRTPRRTPRATPCRMILEPAPIVNVEEVFTHSEKDPLSSSGNSGSKLCKAMLEDLILKGFRCCKCIDDEEGELDYPSFDTSIKSVIEVMEEKIKSKNDFMYSSENILSSDIPEYGDRDAISRNSVRSQNSVGTGAESGIEVTGSDFHSSAATHFDQRSASLRDSHVNYQEKYRDFGGHLDQRETGQCSVSLDQVSKDTERYSERKKHFGSETATNCKRSACNDIDDVGKQILQRKKNYDDYILNENLGVTSVDQARKQPSGRSYNVHHDVDVHSTTGQDTQQRSGKSDHILHSADIHSTIGRDTQRLGEKSDHVHHNAGNHSTVGKDTSEKQLGRISDHILHKTDVYSTVGKDTQHLGGISDHIHHNADIHSTIPIGQDTEQLSGISDHIHHNADIHSTVATNTQQLGESDDILDGNVNELPDLEKDTNETLSNKMYNQHLAVTSAVEEDEQLSQSSQDSYRTPDEILDAEESPCDGLNMMYDSSEELSEINGDQLGVEGTDTVLDESVVHVCKLRRFGNLGSTKEGNGDAECSKDDFKNDKQNNHDRKCCEVDGLLHANLFVQAYSEIVLILLAKCDLYQNEEAVKSLWSTSLSKLGELDILMKNCEKEDHQDAQVPFNLLIYDNFEKSMSGNLREPVFAQDHVFCETSKTLHNHFNNAPQLCDVTLRNFLSGIHSERALSREAYYQESITSSSDRHVTPDISGYLAQRMRECITKDHGLPFV